MIKRGVDCQLFRGEAGKKAETLVENVKDVTLNMESGEADATTRKSGGWKAYLSTTKEASLEFSILYDPEDEDYRAFNAAYMNNTPLAFFVSDGSGEGLDADFTITNFSMEQPLEEAVSISVTAKITAAGRAPEWVEATA